MKAIRNSVFETNSSSSHSITIGKQGILSPFCIPINDDGYVVGEFGEFGWGYEKLKSQSEKLSYLLTMVAITEMQWRVEPDVDIIKLFEQTVGFQSLNKFVSQYCNGISLECIGLEVRKSFDETDTFHYVDYYGYIDHQSCGHYNSLQNFLDYYELSIEEIILNDDVVIIIDNDNH